MKTEKAQVVATVDPVQIVRPETEKYTKIMDRVIGAKDVPSDHVLLSVKYGKTPRPGTATAYALDAMTANIGKPEPVVLAAVAEAERKWHRDTNRAPKAVSPVGWVRTFNAKFGAVKA